MLSRAVLPCSVGVIHDQDQLWYCGVVHGAWVRVLVLYISRNGNHFQITIQTYLQMMPYKTRVLSVTFVYL